MRRPNAIHQLGDLKKMTTLPLHVPLVPWPIIDISQVLAVFATVTEVLAEADQQATAARKRLIPAQLIL